VQTAGTSGAVQKMRKGYAADLRWLRQSEFAAEPWIRNWAYYELREADLRLLDLRRYIFDHSDLTGAILYRCNLTDASFVWTTLRKANLSRCDLYCAKLRSADLRGANLMGADLRHADLRNAKLAEANLWKANLIGADTRGCDFSEACIQETLF
jgi:uncharacterized protein YjbI with pentapeptide repeats